MGCLLNEQVQTYVFKIPEIIYKSCFRRKDLPMEKITCHSWHHLAMEDAFLGRLGLFESVSAEEIVERLHEPTEKWVEPNGKEHKFRRFPGAYRSSMLIGHSKGNDITCTRA